MASAVVSGIISNILLALDDSDTLLYPSGKVQQMIFSCLPGVNGFMGSSYAGNNTDGIITPDISGLAEQKILEVYVVQELLRKEIAKAARSFNLTSFTEGDSKVTMSSSAADFKLLMDATTNELKNLIRQAKYTAVSTSPTAVIETCYSTTNAAAEKTQSGSMAIPLGASTVTVSFLSSFATTPTVTVSVVRATGDDLIYANVRAGSTGLTSFIADFSAATATANYSLSWTASVV